MTGDKHDEQHDDIVPTEETVIDDLEVEELEHKSEAKVLKIKKDLKACQSEKHELQEELQRTKAEFLNARKRLEEQKFLEVERATDTHIMKLLPVCDSFAMAMRDKDAWEATPESWRVGMESIYNQLQSILRAYGVTTIDPVGVQFDPEEHEAMSTVDNGGKADTIVEVLQLGYKRNETVIRPAKVTIHQ